MHPAVANGTYEVDRIRRDFPIGPTGTALSLILHRPGRVLVHVTLGNYRQGLVLYIQKELQSRFSLYRIVYFLIIGPLETRKNLQVLWLLRIENGHTIICQNIQITSVCPDHIGFKIGRASCWGRLLI